MVHTIMYTIQKIGVGYVFFFFFSKSLMHLLYKKIIIYNYL